MDFEPESWDVSAEANELNSSLFSSRPTKRKHEKERKLTGDNDRSRFRHEIKHSNVEERSKTTEIKDGSSVTDLKKKNKRNKYFGFDKSDKGSLRNVRLLDSADYLDAEKRVLDNVGEIILNGSDGNKILNETSHSVENVQSKFDLQKQMSCKQSSQKSSYNTFASKDKRDFCESGPRKRKIKFYEKELKDDLSVEQTADRFTGSNSGTVSPQRFCVGLGNHDKLPLKKRQRNGSTTGWKVKGHATNVSLVKNNKEDNATATVIRSEHESESIPLLDERQQRDNESSRRKRNRSSSKDINHAGRDQELNGPSKIKKKNLKEAESNISGTNIGDDNVKKDVGKKKKRKRKDRKNKFRASDTPVVGLNLGAGQDDSKSGKRELDSSSRLFEDRKGRIESKSSETEFDDFKKVGMCKNLHGKVKEISIMYDTGDTCKSVSVERNSPSIKEDRMQTFGTGDKAKKLKKDFVRAEKVKNREESERNFDRVSLPFTPKKISKILAKEKKHSELKITGKAGSTDMGNENQSAVSNTYPITATKTHSGVSANSVTNLTDLINNRLKKKQSSNELHGGSSEIKKKSLLQVNIERLKAARFRFINEQLYSRTGAEAFELFKEDPEAFDVYHKGFQGQVDKWPVNPLDVIIDFVKSKPVSKVVADFGCGDAKLAQSVSNKVHSFDLVALNKHVTVCDIADVPLSDATVDIAVFCLSLMGTNLSSYLSEANRVLKKGGLLLIAEVASRFVKVKDFVIRVEKLGFQAIEKVTDSKMFILMKFQKKSDVKNKLSICQIKLKPCVYKKR